jgi:hypothetical protein
MKKKTSLFFWGLRAGVRAGEVDEAKGASPRNLREGFIEAGKTSERLDEEMILVRHYRNLF